MSESANQRQIIEACDAVRRVQMFRNNRGRRGKVTYGLNNTEFKVGTSDLIGWVETTITEDMVGSHVAVFCAIEVKENERSSKSFAQIEFGAALRAAGGLFGFVSSVKGAMSVITGKGDDNG